MSDIDKLSELLLECLPFIRDAGNDEDPEAQSRAADLTGRIEDALAQHLRIRA